MKLFFALTISLNALNAAEPVDLLRTWQGIPGVEVTPKGRLFVSWFSGGTKEPTPENTVYLSYSDDRGKSFGAPVPMAGPVGGGRAFDPALWRDPAGRLWYLFNRGNKDTAEHGVYARICDKPDAARLQWGVEFRVGFDEAPLAFRLNKPTVLKTGEWILPVTHAAEKTYDWFAGPKQLQGVGISSDKGKTWKLHGSLVAPHWALENMVVQLRDGRLWMLMRTGSGVLWESYSSDHGRTWSAPAATTIASPGSRFFIRRLKSGNLLLVNHFNFKGRSHITARLSKDDGKIWNDGLLLDERAGVSYPDGVEAKDGLITVVYDRDRAGAGEILMAAFREADVEAGKVVSSDARMKQLVNRLDRDAAVKKMLLPGWDAKAAGDRVMKSLIKVTAPEVKGAHDADLAIVDDKAYIPAMANDVQPSENPEWPFIYVAMAVVDMKTMSLERIIPVARGGQKFPSETLREGAIFVPRILKMNAKTLRCYFASEMPRQRQSQMYYRDFDLGRMEFEADIHRAKIKTAAGTFDMQPDKFYADAAAQGFKQEPKDYGLYMIDSFKVFDRKTYAVLNNFPGRQNGWGVLNSTFDTFEVLGHFNEPGNVKLSEAAVNRMPDGTWLSIARQEGGNGTYLFSTSKDGRTWTANETRPFVPSGTSSKPTFDRFFGVYYLGWQDKAKVDGVSRSVFNIDISVDGVHWERKYRFETANSFQYPTFREYKGSVYLTVTQGDSDKSRKERIMFGKLE